MKIYFYGGKKKNEQRAYIERLERALRIVGKRTEYPTPAPFFRDYTGQWWQLTPFSYGQLTGNWSEIQRVVKEALAESQRKN
jgi:hypothetical protein